MSRTPLDENRLESLSASERNRVESQLMEFEQAWYPESLVETSRRAQTQTEPELYPILFAELVKIDMHRCWATGIRRELEHYLQEYPVLGTPESVDPALVLAEFRARRGSKEMIKLESLQGRFPKQYDDVKRMAETAASRWDSSPANSPVSSESRPPHAHDTSRIGDVGDTKTEHSTEVATPKMPTEFGRYRIVKQLGAGAMGKVFLAIDTMLDRHVALKTPSFEGGEFDGAVTRFYREAKAAAKLQHRNICAVYDVGEINGQHFISMAYIKGRCLSDYVQPDSQPSVRTSATLVHRLAMALAEAHHHKVIHRDLKPANIMIDAKREPVVMDFGLARQTDTETRLTQSGMAIGTPAYMSPEQVRGKLDEVGPGADVYSLGVILYELLTGHLPFSGGIAQVVYAIVNEPPTPIRQHRPDVDDQLEAICNKMMAKRLSARYQSMDEVAADLNRYLKYKRTQRQAGAEAADWSGRSAPADARSSSATSGDCGSSKSSGPARETDVLHHFFQSLSTDDSNGTVAESSSPDAVVREGSSAEPNIEQESQGKRTRRRPRSLGLGVWGLGAAGLALLSGVVITFSDGSRVEVADDASAKIEVNANGAISSVTITPKQAGTTSLASSEVTGGKVATDSNASTRLDVIPQGMTPYDLLTSKEYEWSEPKYLGLFPYHAKNLHRELGDFLLTHYRSAVKTNDAPPSLFVLKRNRGDSHWQSVVRLNISSAKWDWHPSLSRDGLQMVFQSNRSGGKSPSSDLWLSRRETLESPWSKPVIIYQGSTKNRDEKPCFAENGLAIYFNSASVKGKGTTSLVVTRRATLQHRWSPAKVLGPEVRSRDAQHGPSLVSRRSRSDFCRTRNRESGDRHALWMSTRAGIHSPWSKPTRLDDKLGLEGQVLPRQISSDGRTLIMRYVPYGGGDPSKVGTWVSHRIKKSE